MRVTTVDDRCRLFFDMISTISNFSVFLTVQEGPGRLLGAFLGDLGRSFGVLEGVDLGSIWVAQGGSK